MKTTIAAAAAAIAALATAAFASPTAGESARSCFRASNVNGWTSVDRDTLDLHVGARDVYRVELMSPCGDINFSEGIGIESRGSSMICSGLEATLIVPSTIGPRRCPARSIHKLDASRAAPAEGRNRR